MKSFWMERISRRRHTSLLRVAHLKISIHRDFPRSCTPYFFHKRLETVLYTCNIFVRYNGYRISKSRNSAVLMGALDRAQIGTLSSPSRLCAYMVLKRKENEKEEMQAVRTVRCTSTKNGKLYKMPFSRNFFDLSHCIICVYVNE